MTKGNGMKRTAHGARSNHKTTAHGEKRNRFVITAISDGIYLSF